MGTILIYEMKAEREQRISELAEAIGHNVRKISISMYEETLGHAADIHGFPSCAARTKKEPLGEEMLIFSGMDGNELDIFLANLRENGLTVGLKAVLTPYNIRWNSRQLHDELAKERANLQKRKSD